MKYVLSLSLLLFCFVSVGQENSMQKHPIDVAYLKCLDNPNNQTTIGMINCAIQAKKAWELEVEKYYKLLLAKVSEEHKAKLKASQEAWKAYKQKEISFSKEMYLGMGGTMWQIVAADHETEFVKQRALLLKSHYETLLEKDE
jgi:uncharacterized protein YecT (DUF1311 family)